MARILLGSYMVRYPLGGMMSWVLQYLVGLHRLGHEVYLVERSGYENACYDPVQGKMTNDCAYGAKAVDDLLRRHGLDEAWCYVDHQGEFHGLTELRVRKLFETADVFIDMGTHGTWMDDAEAVPCKVLIDGEPGFTQMKMQKRQEAGETLPEYDHYFTTGQNIGTPFSSAPTAGKDWQHIYHPVVVDLFPSSPPPKNARFTTVMNWQSYEPLEFHGEIYGHKDVEFQRIVELPSKTPVDIEVAVSGMSVPHEQLTSSGWSLQDAHQVTATYDSFVEYVRSSQGELGVCKNGYVATCCGWFSDRSAAYLASGRAVVLQDTGFSEHLPTGEGLFAFRTADEAAQAIDKIKSDPVHHSQRSRELAREFLDAPRLLQAFLARLGIA